MDAFVVRKRRRLSDENEVKSVKITTSTSTSSVNDNTGDGECEGDSTDLKLAVLSSLFPRSDTADLLDILVAHEGSVEAASATLSSSASAQKAQVGADAQAKAGAASGYSFPAIQRSLSRYAVVNGDSDPDRLAETDGDGNAILRPGGAGREKPRPLLTKKGKTLHLYSPDDVAAHTPCSIIHNFLPPSVADELLKELLLESSTFERQKFQLFDQVVQSPHTMSFYVHTADEQRQQREEYLYNGSYVKDVRSLTPQLRRVSPLVQDAVNAEVRERIRSHYPGGKKLRFQSSQEWRPNAAFVNCYNGPAESVGYHSDQLTYLGPRAVIGSISLGVEREFRVRRVVAKDGGDDASNRGEEGGDQDKDGNTGDVQGQISIHLPHNSLLVMHAEMQEEWKHSIAPAQTVSPHPIAGNKRINITYRWYRESLHPRYTPRCRCGIPTVLRCVQRKKETRGRYMWMCHANYSPGKTGCPFFQWAEFDDDGDPIWSPARPK